jgi:hypothetical protein
MADPEVKEKLLKMLDEVSEKAEENANAIERMFGNSKGAGVANMFFGDGDFLSKIKSFSTTFKGAEKSSSAVASNSGKAAAAMQGAGKGMQGAMSKAQGTIAIIDAIINGINQTINGIREVVDYLYEYEKAMNVHASQRAKDNAEFMSEFGAFNDKVFSGWNNLKEGNVVGAITDNIIAWHRGLTWGKRMAVEWQREINESLNQQIIGEIEINQLYRERYEWAKKIGEATLSHIARSGTELKKQAEENQKDQDALWKNLMEKGEYKSEDYIKKRELWGIDWLKKDQHIETWSSLAGKTWEEIELLAAQGLLSEEGMKFYEALRKSKEEGEDIAARMEEFAEEVREIFTGTTYDSLVNSIIDGFKAGKRSAADFADTFEELMKGAVASALKMSADDRIREYYETFAELAKDGLTEDEILYLRNLWNTLIEAIGKDAENLKDITGIDIGSIDSENTLKGAYAKASQESIDLLAGQTGALRKTVEQIYAILNERYTLPAGFVESVMGGMNAIPELIASGLHELIAIRELNVRMAASSEATAVHTQKIGEISQRMEVIGHSVDGKLDSLADIADHTAAIGDIAGNTGNAAGSLHNMERNVNVKFKGL